MTFREKIKSRKGTIEPVERKSKDFVHKGDVLVGDEMLRWRESAGGEILFERRQHGKKLSFSVSELGLDEHSELQLTRKLLMHYRPHAIPDRNGYYAASIGITDDGKMMVDVNNELNIKHPFAGRGCSETGMLRTTQKDQNTPDVQFRKVYLMSGMATKLPDGSLLDKFPGHVSCLCGECRQNLRAHTRNATFMMVPTGDTPAELTINSVANAPSDLKPGEAWEIAYDKMYPLPEQKLSGADSQQAVRNGYIFVTDTSQPPPALKVGLPPIQDIMNDDGTVTISMTDYRRMRRAYESADLAIDGLRDHPTIENINRALMQIIKKAYNQHEYKMVNGRNLEINVVLVKTNSGDFFPGITVNGEMWLPNKPPELPGALANAYNDSGISHIYMMTFNDRQICDEMAQWHQGVPEGHSCKMPDPAALGRVIKNLLPTDNPSVTVFPPNDTGLSEEKLMQLSHTINVRESFGPDFANPKRTISRAEAVVPAR